MKSLNNSLIIEKLHNIKFITYEELNQLIPAEYISEEDIESVFDILENFKIIILNNSEPYYRLKGRNNNDTVVHNLIDTPDKFYFYELNKSQSSFNDKEHKDWQIIQEIKNEISALLYQTDFFIFQFYKSIRKLKKVHTLLYGSDTVQFPADEFKKLFQLYTQAPVSSRARKKDILTTFLKRFSFRFSYILNLINELKEFYYSIQVNERGQSSKEIEIELRKKKISIEELKELLKQINTKFLRYDKIKQPLVISYLPFVISIARHYSTDKITFNDLVQEGNLALIEAVDHYDLNHSGKSFIKFSSHLIKKRLKETISFFHHGMQLSQLFQQQIKTYLKTIERLRAELLRMPEIREIKAALNWDDERITLISNYLKSAKSLEQEAASDNTVLGEALHDKQNLEPEQIAVENVFKDKINELISELKEKEQAIIKMRFGFNPENKTYSYDEISAVLNIPINTITAVEEHALKKLKVIFKRNKLDEFIEME